MKKHTIIVAIISSVCTLLIVGLIGVIAVPKVIDKTKDAVVVNFDDEYQELSNILDQSIEPVLQKNYIITGLIMSPDFQEYLDEGVQNGWWTEEFLEQFLIDESLPIFFTNYHVLVSAIISSDGVQDGIEKLTTIKAKALDIIYSLKSRVLNTVYGIRLKIQSTTNAVYSKVNAVNYLVQSKTNDISNKVSSIKGNLNKVYNSFDELLNTINDVIEKLQTINFEKIISFITYLQTEDFSALIDLINDIKELIEKINNNGFDGILQQILENVLNSDFVIAILDKLDNLEASLEGFVKILNFYFTKFVDVDYDTNFYEPVTIAGNTYDLSKYARLLNVLDVYIPEDGFTYDDNGTPAKLGDDSFTINVLNIGFEVDGIATNNVINASDPIVIEGAKAKPIYLVFKNNLDSINNFI